VEELFSIMTVQICPATLTGYFRHEKIFTVPRCGDIFLNHKFTPWGRKITLRNVSAVHFIIVTFFFISGISKLFGKDSFY
jgi:hypothetical protein